MMRNLLYVCAVLAPMLGQAQPTDPWYDGYPDHSNRDFPMRGDMRYGPWQDRDYRDQGRRFYFPQRGQQQMQNRQQRANRALMLKDTDVKRVITNVVNNILANRGKNLRVMVQDGTVVIQGAVSSEQDLDRINRLVHTLENLQFDVRVSTESRQAMQKNNQQASVNYCPNCGSLTYLIAAETLQKEGSSGISDSEIKQKIDEQLKNSWFGPSYESIEFEVNNGVVTITGIVEDEGDIEDLEQTLKDIEGVRLIKNHVTAKSSDQPSARNVADDHIKNSVEQELQNSWWGNYKNVRIDVEDGVVILTGSVENQSDIKEIEDRLSNIPGVKAIRNQLNVKDKSGWSW